METEYDRKFAEMKKYIPFLECMIGRLESTSLTSEQPRRAQLDKIRSLRDLLLDKKKRGVTNDLTKVTKIMETIKEMMKMENLLKCEQVLVNLRAKMEQQTDIITKESSEPIKDKADLEVVRNKLKSVVNKSLVEEDNQSDTFEIASRSETEELCTSSGSKEPALFQRRANRPSSPSEKTSSPKPVPKRNYTRVLVSPEPGPKRTWTDYADSGKPLFRRRSPKKSPKKTSPTYHKKERKTSSSRKKKTSKDLNITLNVPEESLSSLNTEDILSRIINCNDNDVDIDTLRDVREQILGELEKTGAGDITEAIMKSYKKKSKLKKSKVNKKPEVEEGELSDSESEAIKSIYGSLVLVDKDKSTSEDVKSSNEKGKKPRKIQICLVINKDKADDDPRLTTNDVSEFELFDIDSNKESEMQNSFREKEKETGNESVLVHSELTDYKQNNDPQKSINKVEIQTDSAVDMKIQSDCLDNTHCSDAKKEEQLPKDGVSFTPNFYKSINEPDGKSMITLTATTNTERKNETKLEEDIKGKESDENINYVKTDNDNRECQRAKEIDEETNDFGNNYSLNKNVVQIPLLNEDPPVPPPPKAQVSEIDILQALKNEILSENIGISTGETSTPHLHQPKVTKVASAQEITKKRISIEKYKEKVSASKQSLFLREPSTSCSKEDNAKKQSLKLTEKECERFNFPLRLALDDSSNEEKDPVVLDDIYGDLVPKSPERDDANNTEYSSPVIIPVEPVKLTVVNSTKDIDMRKLPVSPPTIDLLSPPLVNLLSPSPSSRTNNRISPNKSKEATRTENQSETVYRPPQIDPRLKWELNMLANTRSPISQATNNDITARPKNYPNMTPSMTPTRNVRTYEMTPSRQSFEFDDSCSRKHVYAPILPVQESIDQRETSVCRENQRQPHWEPHSELSSESRGPRWESSENNESPSLKEWGDNSSHKDNTNEFQKSIHDSRRDRFGYDKRDDYTYNRSECPRTPVHPFGRSDSQTTPNPSFGRLETPLTPVHAFGRSDCPPTPNHPFGRSERPMTPSHSFGRSELPMTPSHPFGRSEASMTPSHSFGRCDGPMTPSHPFGRSDAPMTSSNAFGRSEAPMTPTHPFGRSDFSHNVANKHKDPRLNRSGNYELSSRNYDNRERSQFNDRRSTLDSTRNFREKSVGRGDMTYERNSHGFNREMSHHEPSVCRSRDYESNNFYAGDRSDNRIPNYYENEGIHNNEHGTRRGFQRDRSVGLGTPSTDRYHYSSRDPNNSDNTLSVKRQSGRSFTIDTSVNRTFQEFLTQKGMAPFAHSFNERRGRASSVGRALLPDPNSFNARRQRSSSVGRALLPDPGTNSFGARRERATSVGRNLIPMGCLDRHNMRESSVGRTHSTSRSYSRAQSIGRDIGNHRNEKSFHEIKADFQSYSAHINKFVQKKPVKQMKYVDPRTKKERKQELEQKWNKQASHILKPYSPRKNPRDPRFRRELENESRHKNVSDRERERKRHGIVYSNDNIAKGTILGSGYGVKNYKIPKIKRPVEEKVEYVETDKSSEKKELGNRVVNSQNKDKDLRVTKEISKKHKNEKDNQRDRKTDQDKSLHKSKSLESASNDKKRTNLKNEPENFTYQDYQTALKSKKNKKTVITNSDSDDENPSGKKYDQNSLLKENETCKSSDITSDKNQDDLLDTSFGMEDLEIPDNINALIADLDNDLEDHKTNKSGNTTKKLSIENLFDSINSAEENRMTVEESLKDLSDLINADMDNSEIKKASELTSVNKGSEENDEKNNVKKIEKEIELQSSEISKPNKHEKINQLKNESNECANTKQNISAMEPQILKIEGGKNNKLKNFAAAKPSSKSENAKQSNDINKTENMVSTSDITKGALHRSAPETNEHITETSTPDSTIDSNKTTHIKEHLPDSTNEIHIEMHSHVTSSHETAESSNKSAPSTLEAVSELSSVENILTLLQDKSKIKQLLSMIGGDKAYENEKLKKKLEKLSEIVSDEEESNDAIDNKVTETSDIQDSSIEKEQNETIETKNQSISSDSKKMGEIFQENDKEQQELKTISSGDIQVLEKEAAIIVSKTQEVASLISGKSQKLLGKKTKRGKKKPMTGKAKRITRSGAAALKSSKAKSRGNRELKQLQEDIKEMFIKDDVLNATGIRMCRLAKLVDDKNVNEGDDIEPRPIVVLEKFKPDEVLNEKLAEIKNRKKPGSKVKPKAATDKINQAESKGDSKIMPKMRSGPKSQTKPTSHSAADPYDFDADLDTFSKQSDDGLLTTDSEEESLASSASFGSSEVLAELKKKPRKKRGRAWQSGVIKPKKKKKKVETKIVETPINENSYITAQSKDISIPDMNSFTDKSYCFRKNSTVYPCRLCEYSGDDIVHHYKIRHPHSEVPLSRMNPETARDAIKESEELNFQAISKISTEKYVCRFCFKELISKRKDSLLETFFWHVVSTHTGEYKQLCSECINVTRCPFSLDIPPPPKDVNGQLIGYICEKCNFTQLSLENLKIHVIVRHNDEQTSVYMINLAFMNKKRIKKAMEQIEQRVLRSSRSNQNAVEQSEGRSDISESIDYLSETDTQKSESMNDSPSLESISKSKKLRSKLTFETEDNASDISNTDGSIKIENSEEVHLDHDADKSVCRTETEELDRDKNKKVEKETLPHKDKVCHGATDDVVDLPHFKVSLNRTGPKEYVCCINGADGHYKTTLLISMKKHVQINHKDNWDGYCSICKVIVMPQGSHTFKDCFQHLLDNHIDNFPVLEQRSSGERATLLNENSKTVETVDKTPISKTYINVRPLSELISKNSNPEAEESPALPVIESVISLGASIDHPRVSPTVTTDEATSSQVTTPVLLPTPPPRQSTPVQTSIVPIAQKPIDYEKIQADILAQKQQVVLDAMMSYHSLVRIYKCAGRYCCFSTDSAEHALLHASAHQRLGGENSLICAYCNFDCSGNAIDLVTHVFKAHGRCQFACNMCFYRAAASQLVSSHMSTAHGGAGFKGVVLKTSTVTPGEDASTELLTREVAVAYYTCVNAPTTCKYRTYIENKFGEHLAKHEPPFLCSVCSVGFSLVSALLEHLKCHDMKLYQCTWCVNGSDNEASLLAHAAAYHPSKVPQAYLRVVTTKEAPDGTLKMMVLPLAQFNNAVVSTELVTPPNIKENPVREAERAIELEKLMSVFSTANNSLVQESENLLIDASAIKKDPTEAVEQFLLERPQTTTLRAKMTPSREDLSKQTTPVLKTEPVDASPVQEQTSVSEVISLDSDEDDSITNIIDLSDDDVAHPSDQRFRVQPDQLYKCSKPNCLYICKRAHLFRKHLESCFVEGVPMKCAHCPIAMKSIQAFIQHYVEKHGIGSPKINLCGVCGASDLSLANLKRHFRREHSSKDLVVSSNRREDGTFIYTVREAKCPGQVQKTTPNKERPGPSTEKQKPGPSTEKQKPGPKRKLSGGNLTELPTKKKRYGPQDVHQLPAKPILDELVYCALCEFNTKVRLNLVRHLQLHAEKQPVAQTVPVNPVPHLETNEKHFDKMVNLASSSVVTRAPDKITRSDVAPSINLVIPPEAASRYPKYVPERQRLTCGAKGCSYTSVDEGMLKCHWETLHAGSNDYHCVHCPPYQHLDTSKPLTAARIIAHLKMHDVRLYACPSCTYYHHKRQVLEKHLNEAHQGLGQVMVVREEGTLTPAVTSQPPPSSGPTMDLKPWQCGLCKFKSMLRQEVVEHCAKFHNSKMQFKCPNCPFRTSTIENVTKHQSKSHPGSSEEVIYFYYREGSIADEVDGTPRWLKQRQRTGTVDPEVKEEVPDKSIPETPMPPVLQSFVTPAVDLNIVKKELPDNHEETIEDLCIKYGQFCEPNGLKYKCPLCKIVDEDSKETMQSHLFEELQYRKWGCSMCTYKAFHKTGLNDHMLTEHRQNRDPIELPLDLNVEKWVALLLQHQTNIIQKIKENFARQKIQVAKPRIVSSPSVTQDKPVGNVTKTKEELEQAFGSLGAAKDNNYCCPKCPFKSKDQSKMQDHLESELNKIRWRCNKCGCNFQEYHEAQLHCRTGHSGAGARPVEALRDPAVRAAWVTAVLRLQRLSFCDQLTESPIKSKPNLVTFIPASDPLLEVRYEKNVPTPEEEMRARRKRSAPSSSTPDSDDEKLIIDEPDDKDYEDEEKMEPKKKIDSKQCPHCDFSTIYQSSIHDHILRHYNLKPYTCGYCDYNCYVSQCKGHNEQCHPNLRNSFFKTRQPPGPPINLNLVQRGKRILSTESDQNKPKEDQKLKEDTPKVHVICLVCEKSVVESDSSSHIHENSAVYFGKKGEIVVKCCNCLALLPSEAALNEHHNARHANAKLNYAYYKLCHDTREIHACDHCDKRFKFVRDLKSHHNAVHGACLQLKYSMKPYSPDDVHIIDLDDDKDKKIVSAAVKTVARKSTTKLPAQTIAKKSTTKLPFFFVESDSESEEEYSYYGVKPQPLDNYPNVTTRMPFCNKLATFSVKQLSEIIKVDPKVVVSDLSKK